MWPVLLVRDDPRSSSLLIPQSVGCRNASQVRPPYLVVTIPWRGCLINHLATKAGSFYIIFQISDKRHRIRQG